MEEKALKTLNIIKNYVIPVLAAIVVSAVAWNQLNTRVVAYEIDLKKVDIRVTALEQTSAVILQRLASIDTKLDYISKNLDKLTK